MLDEIDISEAELIPLSTVLVGLVNSYNQLVQDINNGQVALDDNTAGQVRALLSDLYQWAQYALDNIQPVLAHLGLPDAWMWELGQLVNGCNTAITTLDGATTAALAVAVAPATTTNTASDNNT